MLAETWENAFLKATGLSVSDEWTGRFIFNLLNFDDAWIFSCYKLTA